jgi:predicted enzyme related to lactoylglutathione lyase
MVIRDGIEIHFGRADGKALNPVSEVRKEDVDIVLWVDDIDALFLELHAKQANIVEGIVPRSYGREIVIRDCNGYLIALVA